MIQILANPRFGVVWSTVISLYTQPPVQSLYVACSLYHPVGSYVIIKEKYFKIVENGNQCPLANGSVLAIPSKAFNILDIDVHSTIDYEFVPLENG